MDTYKSKLDEAFDCEFLELMRSALYASNSSRKRDEYGLWTIAGSRGYVSTWGDRKTWGMTVDSVTPRRWTSIKQHMAEFHDLAVVTQDGDADGVFRLMRLPNRDEAKAIRKISGIRVAPISMPIGRRYGVSPAERKGFSPL